jgi:hypothetical protein
MVLPTHCSRCGRMLDLVAVPKGHDPNTGMAVLEDHLRCPKKVTASWQATLFGDKHDETIVPADLGPFELGDPGPILMEVRWR